MVALLCSARRRKAACLRRTEQDSALLAQLRLWGETAQPPEASSPRDQVVLGSPLGLGGVVLLLLLALQVVERPLAKPVPMHL